MKYVFISGPYTGQDHTYRSYFEISRHILDASEMARALSEAGIGFFCPHLHSAHFEVIAPTVPVDYWYDLDLHFAQFCDAGLFLPSWHRSKGAQMEYDFFCDQQKPLFFARQVDKVPTDLLEWSKR